MFRVGLEGCVPNEQGCDTMCNIKWGERKKRIKDFKTPRNRDIVQETKTKTD